ncbi:hypothetical protein [Breoghania sp.]|uniref:hypothetical protein n=1 Tax=Breoghania sp. TaxID=2065378 RepID=UPI002608AB00|nr:hypothetical protein [Breoghania sp.]MDJ0931864.1 hypothetical protein [Breoghania sp.]
MPQDGIDHCAAGIDVRYYDADFVRTQYDALAIPYCADPFSDEISDLILEAIHCRVPYSVIRIGDGEANILAFGRYCGTHISIASVSQPPSSSDMTGSSWAKCGFRSYGTRWNWWWNRLISWVCWGCGVRPSRTTR